MRVIELSKGHVTIVDDEDFNELAQYRWHYSNGYAKRSIRVDGKKHHISMHRAIMAEACEEMQVDHRNQNKLDNRRQNLRVSSPSQNRCNKGKISNNTTGFKGVFRSFKGKKFRAQIGINGKQVHIGTFKTAEEAALAYNAAAIRLHGEFANLN